MTSAVQVCISIAVSLHCISTTRVHDTYVQYLNTEQLPCWCVSDCMTAKKDDTRVNQQLPLKGPLSCASGKSTSMALAGGRSGRTCTGTCD